MGVVDESEIEEGRRSKEEDKDDEEEDDDEEEEEEEEEEDVDFNPFLKGTPSPEASSSLSSEVEGFEGNSSKKVGDEVRNYSVGDSEHGEGVVMQAAVSSSEPENGNVDEKVKGLSEKNAVGNVNDDEEQEEDNEEGEEEEDAICKRTRARYSLASFTLDELETFLQETDDEDDLLRNVDDEEEYKKFLAAVLLGGDGDDPSGQENEHIDEEEDEENDADFEIELEELLESDAEEVARDNDQKVEYGKSGRRPETRQNRRQRTSAQYEKKLLEQAKRPLRPLFPVHPSGAAAYFPIINGKAMSTEIAPSSKFSTAEDCLINGFTSQQIGQLHCLIHEHVQLLVQVFSLCIVDSSRKHIASQIQGLIVEMVQKCNEVVAHRNVAYPNTCFSRSNMRPSVADKLQTTNQTQCTPDSYPIFKTQVSASQKISSSGGRHCHDSDGQIVSSQTAGPLWMPSIRCPVMSILDVAPLNLAGEYMEDVYNAVQVYRQHHANFSFDANYEREPLFNLPYCPSLAETNAEVPREHTSVPPAATAVPTVVGEQIPKKTLAASIVERAKKQSIALVPKHISKLAHRFLPLFNPALFPHKPPPVAVANRILFTDSEDELLALGIMEYNSDWRAIQRRFLPCKSNHQIFIRQKNRSSSKAPENPIKAVKRIKTSPLSIEEIERIREGLKVFKLDWMSVWKYVVPYRDPSLLRRQWRIALGTQRSYKVDDAKKEKRRIYELNRRKRKIADLANWQPLSEKENNLVDGNTGENHSEDDYADDVNEASVHQGFLADWRPGASSLILNEHPCFDVRAKGPPMNTVSANSQLEEQPKEYGSGKAQSPSDGIHGFRHASLCQDPHSTSLPTHVRHLAPNSLQLNHQVLHTPSNTSKSQIYLLPYRTRRTGRARLVKLAPELPPVNLPPSVRVIPQSDFKSNQSGVSKKIPATRGGGDAGRENIVLGNSKVTKSVKPNGDTSNQAKENVTNSCSAESAFVQDTGFIEERGPDLDLQMHPLLFQASEHGRLPYYPLSCSTGGSHSFSFFSGSQPQLNPSLFQDHQQVTHAIQSVNMPSKAAEFALASCGIDFHPLLQRNDENVELLTAFSIPHNAHTGNHFDAVQNKSFSAAPRPSSPTEKANELDLDIHLSSMSTNGKARESRDTGSSPQQRSTVTNSEIAMKIHKLSSPHQYSNDNCPTVPSNHVPGANALAPLGNNPRRCNIDDVGDQSHPEIVMEQEELSDSDEEIEEHVEFECEEMADSDGDASSDGEPISEMQDKEVSSCATEKVTINIDFDQRCEPRGPFHSTTSILKGSNPFLKLSLTSPAKDAGSFSWLSLDPCATVGPPSMKAKPEGCTINEVPTAKDLASCSPNKDSKKIVASPELVAKQKDDVDMSQQLSLGPLAVSALKKPRKRA